MNGVALTRQSEPRPILLFAVWLFTIGLRMLFDKGSFGYVLAQSIGGMTIGFWLARCWYLRNAD